MYAPVTGYFSLVYGTSALENAENSVLSGDDPGLFGSQLSDLLTGRNKRGGSVVLTLNKAAQEAAYEAMQNPNGTFKRGAVVALDPTTGAILAAVSTPSFDPNTLSSHDTAAITAYYPSCWPTRPSPLLNRAFNQTVRARLGVQGDRVGRGPEGRSCTSPTGRSRRRTTTGRSPGPPARPARATTRRPACTTSTTRPARTARPPRSTSPWPSRATPRSPHWPSQKIGGQNLKPQAQLFGLDSAQFVVPLGVSGSTIGTDADLADKAALAQTAFGQRDVRITPLQAAMISSAVANEGTLMKPYLVAQERGPNLSLITATKQKKLSQVLPTRPRRRTAADDGRRRHPPRGHRRSAAITDIPGVIVGGKTGTADTGS